MNNQYFRLVDRAATASRTTGCPERGVVISVDHIGSERYEFVLWTLVKGKIVRHRLLAEVTNLERLTAHAAGFNPT